MQYKSLSSIVTSRWTLFSISVYTLYNIMKMYEKYRFGVSTKERKVRQGK